MSGQQRWRNVLGLAGTANQKAGYCSRSFVHLNASGLTHIQIVRINSHFKSNQFKSFLLAYGAVKTTINDQGVV